ATRKVPEARESGSEEAEEAKQKSARQELRSRHLQETLRTIPRSVVESKWAPLDPPSVSVIGSILADAQRSVLLNLQDTNRRRQHASAAILQVSQRIHGKLLKGFPFPAPTVSASTRGRDASHEADFDFERTLDAKANLENTLSPLLHSVSLLRKQLLKEEYELAGEYNHLHQLETNVKHEAKEWRDKARKEHILAPGRHSKGEINDENELPVELLPAAEDSLAGSLFQDLQNQELAALSQQIKSHMESLRGNLEQIGGVGADINKSKAALQQVLLKHLNEEQYETVLLG
ncbi:CENP-Q, a CENPA-CAD centromere complex subunit-domain-containing protein, partial [Coniella lustricola]